MAKKKHDSNTNSADRRIREVKKKDLNNKKTYKNEHTLRTKKSQNSETKKTLNDEKDL